jgi:hypothetical protein
LSDVKDTQAAETGAPQPIGDPKTIARLNLIFEVGRASLSKLEMGELLNTAAEAIQRHFGYYDVSIFLMDPEASECVLVAHAGQFIAEDIRGYRQKLSVGIVGHVAATGETALANDVRQDPRHIVAFAGEAELLSELAVPIRLHDRTLGVINVEKQEANAFDDTDVMALETLSDQIAGAIANAQLFEQTRLLLDLNRSIIDAVPCGLCVLDPKMHVLLTNNDFCQMFSTDEEAVKGHDVHDVLPTHLFDTARIESAAIEALHGGSPKVFQDIPVRTSEGDRILVVTVSQAQMPEGAGVLLMLEDVTEWRRTAALAEEQKTSLNLIMAHAPVAVMSSDLDMRFTFWGSGAEKLSSYSESEMLEKATLCDIIQDGASLEPLVRQCRETGSAEGEIALRPKDGRGFPVLMVLGKLLDQASQHIGYTMVMFDITERIRVRQELLTEKQKLEHVVGVLGAGLALIGRDRRVIWANRTINEWFGHLGKDITGMPCHEVYCHRGTACLTCPAETCFATGRNSEVEVALVRSDGVLRQYHHAVTPVPDSKGEVDHVLKLTLDVTDHSKKIYQLSRLRQFGELMQGVLDLDRLLHFVLTCVTAGQALGFNRAILLLVDRDRNLLEGRMAVGPASGEEAGRIWSRIHRESPTLEDLLEHYDMEKDNVPSTLDRMARGIKVPMDRQNHIAVACALGRKPIVVTDADRDSRVDEDFRRFVGSRQFVLAPLVARSRPIGVLYADNLFSGHQITDDHVELLTMFATQAAMAIDNAESYRQIRSDKSHLEEAYRDLAEAQDKLVRSERLLAIGRMATHVAHEIRNPLVTIGGFANNIVSNPNAPRETVVRYSQIIASEVHRLENILSRVMDFTRPPKPLKKMTPLEPIIRETLEQLAASSNAQNVEIFTDFPPEDTLLMLDGDQMKQVFFNLCRNALDVMRDGGRLSLRVAREDGKVSITVANTGEPIRPEDVSKLFEPFYTTKPGGTGLGLALTQKIIQDHEGDIRVVSSFERGTEFIITLPAERTK